MWYQDRIDAYLDDELSQSEKRMFESKLSLDPELRDAVEQARDLRTALAGLPRLKCPQRVTDRVFEITETQSSGFWSWAPACTGIAAAVMLSFSLLLNNQDNSPSAEQLAQAQMEFELAMGYLEKASQSATRHVGAQWVKGGIVAPVTRGLDSQTSGHSQEKTI